MSTEANAHSSSETTHPWLKMTAVSVLVAALALLGSSLSSRVEGSSLPAQAQVINQRSFNVLNTTQPPAIFNAESVSDS
jgi:gluconolactonase